MVSDEDDNITALAPISESNKMASLKKMVWLMVEKSRGEDNQIHLAEEDMTSLTGGKSLVFLYNITKDNINPCQTCNLVFSLTRNNQALAEQVAAMVFHGVKQTDHSRRRDEQSDLRSGRGHFFFINKRNHISFLLFNIASFSLTFPGE